MSQMPLALRLAALVMSVPLFIQATTHPACAAPAAAAAQPTRFAVTVTGAGPDVILIPGLASSAHVWDATVAHLMNGHRVHVLQVAGFAGTPAGPNASGPVLQPIVDELHAYIAANHLRAPAVIGHSLGGLVAMELAIQHPEDVGRLMVVDALPFYGMMFGPQTTVAQVAPRGAALRDTIVTGTQQAYAAGAPATMAALVKSKGPEADAAAEAAAASDHRVVAEAMYDDLTTDIRPQMSRIAAPLTLLYPYDASGPYPQAAVDGLYASAVADVPHHQVERMDGSAHFIMIDQPQRFEAAVDSFLR